MQENHINLQHSKIFFVLFILIFLGSIAMTSYVTISTVMRFLLLVGLLVYGMHILWKHILLKDPHSIVSLVLLQSGEWQLTDRQQKTYLGKLRGDSTITRWLCILRFQIRQQKRVKTCVIFRDVLHSDQYRRLLVQLRSPETPP